MANSIIYSDILFAGNTFFRVTLLIAFACLLTILPFSGYAEADSSGCTSSQCHAGLVTGSPIVHSPVADGECLACHIQKRDEHPAKQGMNSFDLAQQGAKLCFECHDQDSSFSGEFKHGPSASGNCVYCHNPHGSNQKNLLKLPVVELCIDCHFTLADGIKNAPFVHSAIKELQCTGCHNPHSSAFPLMLTESGSSLCFQCHEEMGSTFRAAKNQHAAAREGCSSCHVTHFSEYDQLLKAAELPLCFSCHGETSDDDTDPNRRNIKAEIFGKKYIHGPLEKKTCANCHNPHSSNYGKLLTKPYPDSFYAPFTIDTYSFCLQCHDEKMLTEEKTIDATQFRQGDINLHYLHVNMERKGRTCQACHESHGSNAPHLINERGAPFGEWRIPIRYESTDTGGTCTPGCHRQVEYSRSLDSPPEE